MTGVEKEDRKGSGHDVGGLDAADSPVRIYDRWGKSGSALAV